MVGNPPWEGLDTSNKEFFAALDFRVVELDDARAAAALVDGLLLNPRIARARSEYDAVVASYRRIARVLFADVNQSSERASAGTPHTPERNLDQTCNRQNHHSAHLGPRLLPNYSSEV